MATKKAAKKAPAKKAAKKAVKKPRRKSSGSNNPKGNTQGGRSKAFPLVFMRVKQNPLWSRMERISNASKRRTLLMKRGLRTNHDAPPMDRRTLG
jgi:hypothetical protein